MDHAGREFCSCVIQSVQVIDRLTLTDCDKKKKRDISYKVDGSGRRDVAGLGGQAPMWSKQREIDAGRDIRSRSEGRISLSRIQTPAHAECRHDIKEWISSTSSSCPEYKVRSGQGKCFSLFFFTSTPPTFAQHVWHCRHPPPSD
jgi:hypothetical protein